MVGLQEPRAAMACLGRAAVDSGPGVGRPCRGRDERGSSTVWVICILALVSAVTGWALVWLAAQSTRHVVERAADSAALAAASQALHRLATQSGQEPCASAAQAARGVGAQLTACGCTPLDCTVSVRQQTSLIGALAAGFPELRGLGPIQAASRAGPVGEAGG